MRLRKLICGLVAVNLALLVVAWAAEELSPFTVAMNASWTAGQQSGDVFAIRGEMDRAYYNLKDSKDKIDAIIAEGRFDTVPDTIKTDLMAFRAIMNASVAAMAAKDEVINWKQPEN